MAKIHPTAVLSGDIETGDGAEVGPYCVLDGRVVLGAGVRLIAHVHLQGPIEIGSGTVVYPFCCLGMPGQDFKFKPGDPTPGVKIGRDSILREKVTIHAATRPEAPTTVGDRVMMMAGAHAGHDARIGSGVVMVNGAAVAGHGVVGDSVTLSGMTGVHQFTRVGRLAFMSGGSMVSADVPPFCVAWGRNRVMGLNLVGLRRSGMSREHITGLRRAFREVFRVTMPKGELIERLRERGATCPPAGEMAEFLASGTRAFCPALSARGARERENAAPAEGAEYV
ncbi:MAG: acyl-ACP--UDP-N-acetylglucosamine O-acyltransferase [Phycisphaerae bacterium]|nr:acyl-ACP--UDP-N-acetylglucosamine O-acyltransferase [Phycisphaerae bacterium]